MSANDLIKRIENDFHVSCDKLSVPDDYFFTRASMSFESQFEIDACVMIKSLQNNDFYWLPADVVIARWAGWGPWVEIDLLENDPLSAMLNLQQCLTILDWLSAAFIDGMARAESVNRVFQGDTLTAAVRNVALLCSLKQPATPR